MCFEAVEPCCINAQENGQCNIRCVKAIRSSKRVSLPAALCKITVYQHSPSRLSGIWFLVRNHQFQLLLLLPLLLLPLLLLLLTSLIHRRHRQKLAREHFIRKASERSKGAPYTASASTAPSLSKSAKHKSILGPVDISRHVL